MAGRGRGRGRGRGGGDDDELKTPETDLRQVAIEDSDSEPEYEWTQHLFLVDWWGGTWITADPDKAVETVDLREYGGLPAF